jgi:hypothetical protein
MALESITVARVGTTELPFCGGDLVLKDVDGVVVADGRLKTSMPKLECLPLLQPKDAQMGDRWLSKVKAVTPSETNVIELPHHLFASVKLPYSNVPMWGYTLLGARRAQEQASALTEAVQATFEQACWFMRIDPKTFADQPLDAQLETLCEMQTMATRFTVYARDTSLRMGQDVLVDDWTVIDHHAEPRLAELDCEDTSEHAVTRSLLFKRVNAKGSLAVAQALERRYYTCFAIITLRLGNTSQWVYHAVCIKIPKDVLLNKLGLASKSTTDLPNLLVETTAFSTSNWRYNSPWHTQATYGAVASRLDANTKVSSEMVRTQQLYGHLCSLVSPELLEEHEIGQIQLSHKGKFGAPAKAVMEDIQQVTFTPVKVESGDIETFSRSHLLPEAKLLSGGKPPRAPRTSQRPFKAEFVIRQFDWQQHKEQVMNAARDMGEDIQVESIECYGQMGGVCLTVY